MKAAMEMNDNFKSDEDKAAFLISDAENTPYLLHTKRTISHRFRSKLSCRDTLEVSS